MTTKHPGWFFPETLDLEDPGWHQVKGFAGGNPDQQDLIFLRIDDIGEGCAFAGLDLKEATALRDYLTRWIAWAKERGVT